MVKGLLALWLLARQSVFAPALELAGAAAIVYGTNLEWGRGPAWIVAGIAAVLKAFELDLDRPDAE